MKPVMRGEYIAVLGIVVCLLVLLADLVLPQGVGTTWPLLILVALSAWFGSRRVTFMLAALATLLVVGGYFISPRVFEVGFFLSVPAVTPWIVAVNRSIGIVLIWSAAFLISRRRMLLLQVVQQAEELAAANAQSQQRAQELAVANQQLDRQAEELATANRQLEQQARGLAAANELLRRQGEILEAQAEELRGRNEELTTLSEGLEQRVEERTSELRRVNASLQEMSARLMAVQENERRAISRELHDESSQLLSTIIVRLGLLQRLWEREESPVDAIAELKGMANQLAEGLHRVAEKLRPASLDRAGLVEALAQYVGSYRQTYGLQVDLFVDGWNGDRLTPELESTFYRIIQEALTNVARHAHASHVGVVLHQQASAVTGVIEDDGVGFDMQAAARGGRLGLAGMQERAEMQGGSLTVESQPGAGTTIFVEIPCPPRRPAPPA